MIIIVISFCFEDLQTLFVNLNSIQQLENYLTCYCLDNSPIQVPSLYYIARPGNRPSNILYACHPWLTCGQRLSPSMAGMTGPKCPPLCKWWWVGSDLARPLVLVPDDPPSGVNTRFMSASENVTQAERATANWYDDQNSTWDRRPNIDTKYHHIEK